MSTNIEVSCSTCGAINRVGESDVPAGAKFVPCVSCKSRVALPPMKASRATPPPLPGGPVGNAGSAVGLADLPAPKRQSPLGAAEPSRPAPKSALAAAELPVPRGGARSQTPAASITSSGSLDLDDLLPDSAELPVPRGGRSASDVSDLPAPRAAPPPVKSRAMTDLPFPMPSVSDLPAPSAKPQSRPTPAPPSVSDLPAPKTGGGRMPSVSDLPAPVARGPAISDLPAPRGSSNPVPNLPTPKQSGVVDLPTPKPGGIADVPAPKGFFDDLPQPARGGSTTKSPDLPAPKGFFDDLPGRVSSNKPEVPAPKGFFDDLPGRVNAQKAAAAAAAAAEPEVPAPKGFFEDLPGRPNQSTPQPPAPKGFFDDLPQPSAAKGPSLPRPVNTPVELNMEMSSPSLDLGISEGSQARRFDDLDLSSPSSQGINISTPKAPPPGEAQPQLPSIQPLPSFKKDKGQPASLELEEPRDTMASAKLGPKRKSEPSLDPDASRRRAKRVRIFMMLGLVLVFLGAGGFYFYSRWAAKRAVANTIAEELAKAKDALGKSDRNHWDRATAAADLVIDANNKHAEALSIAAEARLASALSNGQSYGGKLAAARAHIQTAVSENIAGPNLINAQALNAITNGVGDRAVELLKARVTPESKDAQMHLYLGWAYAAAADPATAIKSFDAAIANGTDYIKVCALYGRGQAKLEQADLEGAQADFKAVAELDKEHIGAQVGQAAAMPSTQAQQQEKDLLALFERADFKTGDPRAVVKAWSLAAEAAKRGGRLDAARERYRNALQILPDDLGALAGAAEIELRDGKLDAASDQIGKALAISKDDIRSQLVQSEISIAKNELTDARARIEALTNRNPPPPKLDQSRIKLAAGHLAEKSGKDEEAAELFREAAELAGDADLSPTLEAVAKFSVLAEKAEDPAKATELRGKATKLLEKLEAQADKDPQIALALGAAYLRANDAVKAEPWLRKFVEQRADDAEGQFQLAKALARLDRADDAITRLNRAIELAPKRPEFLIELARTYERAKQDESAAAIYNKLLTEHKDPSVEMRAGAGRFFARRGEKEKAAEQGEAILKVVPNHTAGTFLKAEGLLLRNQIDDARVLFNKAATAERDPQYWDGLGRANEEKVKQSGEVKYIEPALNAYKTATSLDPKMFSPHAGMGRLYMLRNDHALAVGPLSKAFEIKRDEPEISFLIGLAYFHQKETEPANGRAAVQWFKQTLALKPNIEASFRLGQLYRDQNSPKESQDAFNTAVTAALTAEKNNGNDWTKKNMPWLHELLYVAGEVFNRNNDLPRAAWAWDAFINHSPDPLRWRAQLATANNALATGLGPYRK